MARDTFVLLAEIVKTTTCKPGWSFELVYEGDALRFVIRLEDVDNYDFAQSKVTKHFHPVPIATYNEKTWRRWIFEQCLRTMNHEIGEALSFDGVRPFVPMHGPGEDPYTVHEWRSETDALTTQNGSLREGPV